MGEPVPSPQDAVAPRVSPVAPTRPRGRSARGRRVFVEDARRNGQYLRATWHSEDRVFVLSTWREEVCTGAVRIPIEESGDLVGLLVDGMVETVRTPPSKPKPAVPALGDLVDRVTTWLRRR